MHLLVLMFPRKEYLLQFKAQKAADEAHKRVTATMRGENDASYVDIADDYGRQATVDVTELVACILTSTDGEKRAGEDIQRTQQGPALARVPAGVMPFPGRQ